jgi:CubicO group peptidase (beta-lactamase class C family)
MSDSVVGSIQPQLDRLLVSWLEKARLHGMAVGIVRERGLVWSRGFGYSDLETRTKPDELTIFRVASITKTFTALAILQLRDEGLLTLEDPLVLHIPEFSGANPGAGRLEDVTIKRMLTHRAGLTTEPPLPGWDALDFPSMQAITTALPQAEVVIPQDSAFKYSNFAFALLGEVVARLSGRAYVEYVKENILGPLDMVLSDFDLAPEMRQHFATGYSPAAHEDFPVKAPYAHLKGMTSAGQLHSNVTDLAKWVSFQFRTDGGVRDPGKGQVLDGASLEEMHRPVYIEPDWSAGQALAWRVVRLGDRIFHNHGGGIHGFGSNVAFNKPAKTGVIVLANVWPTSAAAQIALDVLKLVLDADAEAAKNAPKPEPAAPEKAPAFLAAYMGRYRAEPGILALIEFRGGALRFADPAPGSYTLHSPASLDPTGKADVLLVRGGRAAGEKAVFKRDLKGDVVSYELGGFVFKKQT